MAFNTKFSLPSFLKQVKKLTDSQKYSIKRAGFGNLLLIPDHVLRRTQLFQLMEKWNSENQTFVFPPGELEINLLDVSLILGLRVTGKPVVLNEAAPLTSLEKEFGASVSNRTLGMELLKERLESVGERDDESFVRVFLLYCFGTLLFPSVNGKVDSRYLCLLEDVNGVSSFAWGAAVLEDLHNCLTQRKSKKTNNIGGCLILLQIWCYEHILTGRPKLLDYPSTFPRVCRWESSARHYSMSSQFNINFEELEHKQILWKLEPTSEEIEIDIIREIPQEWYLRSGPGTIEQPIEIESQSEIRSVTVRMEVVEEEPIRQEASTVFVITDDEESTEIEGLKKEIIDLKMIIEERKEKEAKKRVDDEDDIKVLSKKVQDAAELGKRLKGENEELHERVQYEVELRKTVEFENEELMKRVQDEAALRKTAQFENEELGKKVQDDEELRKRVLDENEELRKRVQDEDDLRKRVQGENEELRKQIQDEEELRKHIQFENEELKKRVQDEVELRKRVQNENEECTKMVQELRKRVQDDEEELIKRVQYENEELMKRVQDENELRKRIQDENENLRKRVQDVDELRKRVQDENEELRKRVQDEEGLRKRVQDKNEELRKRFQDDEQLRKRVQDENEELMKRVQDENEELRKRVQDEDELRKRVQCENEKLCDKNMLMDRCISDLEKLLSNNNSVDL